jgi:hypothetical protein
MRRAIVMLLALTLSVALAVAAGCNPIFGVVSRTQGPTWCEEDAQASAAYCDDFDRVPASTTAMETPEAFHGALQITDAAASSPPNSLGVTSFALTDPGSGALVSNLVNFGNMEAPAQGIVAARCQMDVQPTELATAAKAGTIGIAALGGATLPTGGGAGPGPPKFVFVTYDPAAGYGAQLAVVSNQGVPAVPQGTACALFQGDIDKPWVTIEMAMRPLTKGEAESGTLPMCVVGLTDGGTVGGKHHDGGADASDQDEAPKYVVLIQVGPFVSAVLVPDEKFLGQPFFAYGISIVDASAFPQVTLHIDNVACWAGEGGLAVP